MTNEKTLAGLVAVLAACAVPDAALEATDAAVAEVERSAAALRLPGDGDDVPAPWPSSDCRSVCYGSPSPSCSARCTESGRTTTCGDYGYCRRNCAAADQNPPGNHDRGGRHANWSVGATPAPSSGGAAPGRYDIEVVITSPRRFGHVVNDGGHKEAFCRRRDERPPCTIGSFKMDGVRLKNDEARHVDGLRYSGLDFGMGINGPQFKRDGSGSGEWDEHSDGDHCRSWSRTNDELFTIRYDDVAWSGARLRSRMKIRWKESDPFTWDDHSSFVYFDMGSALTACMRAESDRATLTPSGDPYWFYVCSKSGGCSDPEHFKIRTYYRMTCRRTPAR